MLNNGERKRGMATSSTQQSCSPSMAYKEDFEVVTAPDGTSALSITLACATVQEHYNRTTTAHSTVASDPAEVCSTGLRVYEGAQVLAAFMCRYGVGLVVPPPASSPLFTASPAVSVVELGCGCGLVGFTLDAALCAAEKGAASPSPAVSVVFTDASADCLALVRESGKLAGRHVRDLNTTGAYEEDLTRSVGSAVVQLSTFRLAWSDAGVQALQQRLSAGAAHSMATAALAPAVQLVVGSDLLYYRVDINALVSTAKTLLRPLSHSPAQIAAPPGFVVFAHFMRIPDGRRKLAAVAREHHMSIASVTLTAFLSKEAIQFRGWGGIELVLLVPRPTGNNVRAHGDSGGIELEDVQYITTLLEARAAAWEGALPSATQVCAHHSVVAAQQAHSLAAAVRPYPSTALALSESSVAAGDVPPAEATEEDALLHLLLE
jgi:hypothetical protein